MLSLRDVGSPVIAAASFVEVLGSVEALGSSEALGPGEALGPAGRLSVVCSDICCSLVTRSLRISRVIWCVTFLSSLYRRHENLVWKLGLLSLAPRRRLAIATLHHVPGRIPLPGLAELPVQPT